MATTIIDPRHLVARPGTCTTMYDGGGNVEEGGGKPRNTPSYDGRGVENVREEVAPTGNQQQLQEAQNRTPEGGMGRRGAEAGDNAQVPAKG